MVTYNSVEELPDRIQDRFKETLVEDEEFILATKYSPDRLLMPSFLLPYGPYYVVTNRRFILLSLEGLRNRIETTDIPLSEIARVEVTPRRFTFRMKVELTGPTVHEEYRIRRKVGNPFADALRAQIAKQENPTYE